MHQVIFGIFRQESNVANRLLLRNEPFEACLSQRIVPKPEDRFRSQYGFRVAAEVAGGTLADTLALRGRGIIQLGLLILIATRPWRASPISFTRSSAKRTCCTQRSL